MEKEIYVEIFILIDYFQFILISANEKFLINVNLILIYK